MKNRGFLIIFVSTSQLKAVVKCFSYHCQVKKRGLPHFFIDYFHPLF
jgi:hypothetical protein